MADDVKDLWTEVDKIVRTSDTPEDALAAARELAKSLPDTAFGNRYDERTGQLTSATEAQKLETVLSQMALTAKQRSTGDTTGGAATSSKLSKMLGTPWMGDGYSVSQYVNQGLMSDPSTWMYKPGQSWEGVGGMKYIVVDPNKSSLTADEIANITSEDVQGRVQYINPIDGSVMPYDVNTGKIYQLGAEPTSQTFVDGKLTGQTFTGGPNKSWKTNPDGTITYLTGPNAGTTVKKDGTVVSSSGATGGSANLVTGGSTTATGLTNPYAPGTDQAKAWQERKSAYDLLYSEFNKYGLGALVQPLQKLVMDNVSPSEFSIQLQNTDAYKKRFAGNQERIAKGLRALTPAEYIGLEDQYQNVMRNYGLPASYYAKDSLGTQAGFNQFIANDVSAAELEDRIATAQKRIQYANPEVSIALKTFYPDITNGDILAYVLDPKNGLENIKRRITAAEIGGSAVAMGLTSNETDAEYLARYGVNKQMAQQGYQTIAGLLPRASQLSDIYAQQGATPYTQATAEKEVFGTPGAPEAARQRKKLIDLEQAAFSGSSGSSGGALARERAGGF